MTSQIKYNTPTIIALLQTYIALMEGDEFTYEYFNEVTGLGNNLYVETMKNIDNMIYDLKLKPKLKRIETDVSTNKTAYITYSYKFILKENYRFTLNYELDDNTKILYSAVIVYLMLKGHQHVGVTSLSKYFPKFTKDVFSDLLSKMRNVIGEELFKDELQSYVIEEID